MNDDDIDEIENQIKKCRLEIKEEMNLPRWRDGKRLNQHDVVSVMFKMTQLAWYLGHLAKILRLRRGQQALT